MSRNATLSPVAVLADFGVQQEMIKYTANAFLATKISFINEIQCCERVGADVHSKYLKGLAAWTHLVGNKFLNAGIG
jgi:UDPglucose 6-dehydrogenase